MKKLLPVLCFAFVFFACEKENPEKKPEPVLYPTQIRRTFSYTSDVVTQQYTYNAQNQVNREDIFRNNGLERSSNFSYNAAGKQSYKRVYGSTGRFLEQDEFLYSAGNVLDKMNHAYIDTCLLYTSDAADERSSVDLG